MDGQGTDPILIATGPDKQGIFRITFNRPEKANALNAELAHAWLESVRLAGKSGCQGLIVTGAGRNFCAGFDFDGFETLSTGDIIDRFVAIEQSLQELRAAPFVSVGVAQGAAFGAGADIVAACTYRIGSARTRFRFPGFQFGVALGTRHLTHLIGVQQARGILLENRIVACDEALANGLLTHIEQEKSLLDKAETLARVAFSLDRDSIKAVLRLTSRHDPASDMADLIQSLSKPGLHERIANYRSSTSNG